MVKKLEFSKVFESKIRLQIIACLYEETLSFNDLKRICDVTDGNMSTHTKKLKGEGFISERKIINKNKRITMYSLTNKGRQEFINYIKLLNELVTEEEQQNEKNNFNDAYCFTNSL